MSKTEKSEILALTHHFLSQARRRSDGERGGAESLPELSENDRELKNEQREETAENDQELKRKLQQTTELNNNNKNKNTDKNTKNKKNKQQQEANSEPSKKIRYWNRREFPSVAILKRYRLHKEQEPLHHIFQTCFNESRLGRALAVLQLIRQPFIDLISSDDYHNYDRWFYAEVLLKYYNLVMNTAGKIYDLETAEQLFHRLKNEEVCIQPNCGTFSSLLNTCTHMQEFEKFDHFMSDSRMKKPYTQRIYHSLMLKSFYQGDYDQVLSIYMDMKKKRMKTQVSTDILIILMNVVKQNSQKMGENQSVQAVRHMLDTALKSDIPQEKKEAVLCHSIIIILEINPRVAVTVLEESAQLLGFGLTNAIFSKLIYKHLSDKKDPEAVRAIWNYVKETNFKMDPLSLDSALFIATISGMQDMCQDIWDYYFSGKLDGSIKSILDPAKFFSKLMQYAAMIGDLQKADIVLQHTVELGIPPKGSLYCYWLQCHMHSNNISKLKSNPLDIVQFAVNHHQVNQRAPIESISFFNYALVIAVESESLETFFYVFNLMENANIQRRSGFAWYKTSEAMCRRLILGCMKFYDPSNVTGREETLWMRIFQYLANLLSETVESPLLREREVPGVGTRIHSDVRAMYVEALLLSLRFFKRHHFDSLHEQVRKTYIQTEQVMGTVDKELSYFAEQLGFQPRDFYFNS